MAKTFSPDTSEPTLSDDPAPTVPRDLHATSDIRFVMMEIERMTSSVDRLIDDVKAHGGKIDELRHQVTYVKGGMAVVAFLIVAASFVLSTKWDVVMAAIKNLSK